MGLGIEMNTNKSRVRAITFYHRYQRLRKVLKKFGDTRQKQKYIICYLYKLHVIYLKLR